MSIIRQQPMFLPQRAWLEAEAKQRRLYGMDRYGWAGAKPDVFPMNANGTGHDSVGIERVLRTLGSAESFPPITLGAKNHPDNNRPRPAPPAATPQRVTPQRDNFARDERKERERALIAAYTSMQGSVHSKPGTWVAGGPVETGISATAKALYRYSGLQGAVWSAKNPIERLKTGDSMEFPGAGRMPGRGMRVRGKDPASAIRERLWPNPDFTPGTDMPVPQGINRGRMGEPIEAYSKPPSVEDFLGDVHLRRLTNEKQHAIGTFRANEWQERIRNLEAARDSYIDDMHNGQFRDEGGLDELQKDIEALDEEITRLRQEPPEVGYSPEDYEPTLDSLQGAMNQVWEQRRGRALAEGTGAMNPQVEARFRHRKQDLEDMNRYLEQTRNNLGAAMSRKLMQRMKQQVEKELLFMITNAGGPRPPWYLPPRLTDKLKPPGHYLRDN